MEISYLYLNLVKLDHETSEAERVSSDFVATQYSGTYYLYVPQNQEVLTIMLDRPAKLPSKGETTSDLFIGRNRNYCVLICFS